MEIGSNGSKRLGNTRPNACKNWCFTLNNYNEIEVKELKEIFGSNGSYIMGFETGNSGTPHIQGFISFNNKTRPMELIKNKRIHWEKCKGSFKDNIKYCSKDGNYISNIEIEEEYEPMKNIEFKSWQLDLINIIEKKEINRTIYWYWEDIGNVGKTTFAYHICKNYNAIYLSGKSNDIKSAIAVLEKKPRICIFDFPRSLEEYISYDGIESVKNGIFFNGKYESGMCMFTPPIVICFANFEPNKKALSEDRWIIKKIS